MTLIPLYFKTDSFELFFYNWNTHSFTLITTCTELAQSRIEIAPYKSGSVCMLYDNQD